MKIKSMEAIRKVLLEDPKTQKKEYNWLFLAKVLREMGFKIFLEFNRMMPQPETLFRERRELLNRKNKFKCDYPLEDNVTIEKQGKV